MAPEGAASRAPSASFSSTPAALDEKADLAAARVLGSELWSSVAPVHRQRCPSFCARERTQVACSEPLNPLGPSGNKGEVQKKVAGRFGYTYV